MTTATLSSGQTKLIGLLPDSEVQEDTSGGFKPSFAFQAFLRTLDTLTSFVFLLARLLDRKGPFLPQFFPSPQGAPRHPPSTVQHHSDEGEPIIFIQC